MIKLTITPPSKELSKFVRKIFLIHSEGRKKHTQKNIAHPYIHLTFNVNKPPNPIINGRSLPITHKLFFIGPITEEEVILEYQGKIDQLSFEFSSSGFYSLFHLSPSTFVNNTLPLSKIIDKDSVKNLELELKKVNSIPKFRKTIENFLITKSKSSIVVSDYILKAFEIIDTHNGYIPIKNIVEQLDISERQLRRKFLEVVGIPPKKYCELINAQYIITSIQNKNYKSIQDLAHSSDYYDLSHFCKQFKKIMGFSPTDFINNDLVDISKNLYTLK